MTSPNQRHAEEAVLEKLYLAVEKYRPDDGVHPNEMKVMLAIDAKDSEHQQRNVSMISDALNRRSSNISPLLTRMAKKDLIKRSSSDEDTRVFFYQLTETGQSIVDDVKKDLRTQFDDFKDTLTGTEVKTLRAMLKS